MVQWSNAEGLFVKLKSFFDNQDDQFDSEKEYAFLMSLLTVKAIDWTAAVWESDYFGLLTNTLFSKSGMCLNIPRIFLHSCFI